MLAWVLAALTSCGGDDEAQQDEPLSRAEYQAAVTAVVRDSGKPTALYTDLVTSRAQDECATFMQSFSDEITDLVERVAALEPPADVVHLQEEFVRHARESVERVDEISEEVAAGDVSCGRELNDLLYAMPSSRAAEASIGELESHGYVVFGE